MNTIIKAVAFKILHLVDALTKKRKNSILFLPHNNCRTDNYDIINYKSDNVLCMFNNIIRDSEFNGYELYVGYYDNQKIDEYKKYVTSINKSAKVYFVNANKKFETIKAFMHCCICLTAHVHFNFSFKTKQQNVICLSYYNPFKDDYISVNILSAHDCKVLQKQTEKTFDFHLATSDPCARITSIDLLLDYSKFCVSGFPRNDIFYNANTLLKDNICKSLNMPIAKIICYTPTFRDYERLDLPLGNKEMRVKKTIFGYLTNEEESDLDTFLEDNDSIIIYKLHPWQERGIINSNTHKRIINYQDIHKTFNVSLYDVLSITDILITDYTSTSFDFLHRDKPIIFYFYDFEKYLQNRGFSYNPIESVCGGYVAKKYNELIESLAKCIKGEDQYKEKRHTIHNILNAHHDGSSSDRVKCIIKDVIRGKMTSHNAWQQRY